VTYEPVGATHGGRLYDPRVSTAVSDRRDEDVADAPEPTGQNRPRRPVLYLSEVLVGGAVLVVAVLAWASLILADLSAHALAWVLLLTAGGLAVIVGAFLRFGGRPRVAVDRGGLAVAGVVGILAAVMFLPGFHYGVTDKDPGGYVAHAQAIARTGGTAFHDPALDTSRVPQVVLYSPGARFPGFWIQKAGSDMIYPQFYHLWPALLATADDMGGDRALSNVGPLCGILAVLAAALALRRAVAGSPWGGERTGLLCALIAGVLLSVNMLEVWQAKYPSSEISAQLLFTGGLLALAVTLTTGWRPAAFLAGLCASLGFLNRGDGLILLLLAAAVGAALLALRRWDMRATMFATGVAVVLPHALYQAYSPNAAKSYTLANNVPTFGKVVALVVALFAVGAVLRFAGAPVRRAADAVIAAGRAQVVAGAAALLLVAGLLALGLLRARLFGADYAVFGAQGRQRTYDEQALQRVGWFVTQQAYGLALLGVAVVALRRWGAALWALTLPTLLVLPVYAYHTHNSVRLMWWSRRYVPTVLPGLMILVGLALGVAAVLLVRLVRRAGMARLAAALPALAAAGALAWVYLGQSRPLRSHDEFGGSFAVTKRLAALPGGRMGVFLWPQEPCCLNETQMFAGALWAGRGELSVLLPDGKRAGADSEPVSSYVRSYVRGFPRSPVYVVGHGAARPDIPGVRLTMADRVVTTLPFWQETILRRPDHAVTVPVNFTVWQVAGTG
jgi:hypothetical protein